MNHEVNKNRWNTYRLPCLALVLGGSIMALAVGLKTPLQPRPAIASYTFPPTIPLAGWQPLSHFSLPLPQDKNLTPLANQAYQYQRQGNTLTIEMRYLTATQGDVTQFIRWYTKIPDSVKTEVHQQPGKGSYLFLTYQNKAYLSSCIHPQGQSTATGRQYLQSKILLSINAKQLIGWLTGQDTLFDQRCLWSHLSLAVISSVNPEVTHQILKETWSLWYDWWQTNFPPS